MRLSLTAWGFELDWFVPIAKAAERAGFEAIWISDHLVTPLEYRRAYPYSDSGEPGYTATTPLHDIWPILSAIAVSTATIEVGSGVLILPIRNPFLTAHAAVTLQNLSHGRFLFGVGTGWMEEEFEAVGAPFAERGARTDEILDVLEKLWSARPVSHEGRFYRFPAVVHPPTPVRRIPVLGCGLSDGMLDRTARRLDGWYGPAVDLETSLAALAGLARRRMGAGREGAAADYVRLDGRFEESNLERHQAAGVEHLVVSLGLLGVPASAGLEARVDAILAAGERFAATVG